MKCIQGADVLVWRSFRVVTPEEGDRFGFPFLGTFETANLILAQHLPGFGMERCGRAQMSDDVRGVFQVLVPGVLFTPCLLSPLNNFLCLG